MIDFETKSKVLVSFLFVTLMISVGICYYRFLIVHDFPVTTTDSAAGAS